MIHYLEFSGKKRPLNRVAKLRDSPVSCVLTIRISEILSVRTDWPRFEAIMNITMTIRQSFFARFKEGLHL